MENGRLECRIIKSTSDGRAANTVSPSRWTLDGESVQGLFGSSPDADKNEPGDRFSFLSPLTPEEIYRPSYDSAH